MYYHLDNGNLYELYLLILARRVLTSFLFDESPTLTSFHVFSVFIEFIFYIPIISFFIVPFP